ncbi:MAG: right-handed parallel beta-helix repeat-containing protein [Myxococcales bacterium]|nr:MAG: right-handed parallel beta-helix repeat-containing protein [Myxococcales bacterium]
MGGAPADGGSTSEAGAPGSGSGNGSGGSTGAAGAAPSEGGEEGFEPTYGRFGEAPESTFTLPSTTSAIYYPDVVMSFPEVDFTTLDRLYIPAGEYKTLLLGNLPERAAERPLVITNRGGQVKVGGQAANYVMSLGGGKNWILTGRYDPVSETGDAEFRGHAEGAYAHSQGSYGFLIDDAFSKEGLSGLSIGGKASDFELDCLEVARAEFAGIVAKTDNDGAATMKNVKVHDVYIHDTGSEGIYFGSTQPQPQHSFENLHVYDNRFLRTGTEAIQIGQQGDGLEVHHNVFGPGAVRWRSAFQAYQDGNVQYGQRYGSGSFHHNVVVGTGDLFVELFPTVVAGDPRSSEDKVSFRDNYFSDTSSGGVYTHADDTGVTIEFLRNAFRGFYFDYDAVYPDAKAPVQVFGVGSSSPNPHVLQGNTADATFPFILYKFPSVTESDNTMAEVPPVEFRDFMLPEVDEDVRKLEWWTPTATLSPDMRAVTYDVGAVVVHRGTLYRALVRSSGEAPGENADAWEKLPAPADDVRLAPGSPHQGLGVRWPPATP